MVNFGSLSDLARLDDRVAVVTGAASGIGRAVVQHLHKARARIVLVDVNEDALGKVSGAFPGSIVVHADVSDWAELETALSTGLRDLVPDILVNAAGIYPSAPLLDLDEAHWDRLLDLNLKGVVRMSQLVARRIRDGGRGGAIVHVGSVQGQRSTAGKAAYAASKSGIEALTRVMAKELSAHGIRVNAVAPGPVLTETVQAMIAEIAKDGAGTESSIRGAGIIGTPDEIARVIHFLVSPAASYVNGAIWRVDGGATLD